jgi:hypothetical protein
MMDKQTVRSSDAKGRVRWVRPQVSRFNAGSAQLSSQRVISDGQYTQGS